MFEKFTLPILSSKIMTENKSLIDLGKDHQRLVKFLIQALNLGQMGFLQAGRFLHEIHKNKTYRTEDASREITFTEFCSRPDLPFPGRTRASRLRIAQKLIRVYDVWMLQNKFSEEALAPAGYFKLDILVPVIKERKEEAEDWLTKARLLTSEDLISEVKHKDKSLGEILECSHQNIEKVTFFKCEDCGVIWKKDPSKKDD